MDLVVVVAAGQHQCIVEMLLLTESAAVALWHCGMREACPGEPVAVQAAQTRDCPHPAVAVVVAAGGSGLLMPVTERCVVCAWPQVLVLALQETDTPRPCLGVAGNARHTSVGRVAVPVKTAVVVVVG